MAASCLAVWLDHAFLTVYRSFYDLVPDAPSRAASVKDGPIPDRPEPEPCLPPHG